MAHIRVMNLYQTHNSKLEREIVSAAKMDERHGRKKFIHSHIRQEKINKKERIGDL